jgi:hypothetical protein
MDIVRAYTHTSTTVCQNVSLQSKEFEVLFITITDKKNGEQFFCHPGTLQQSPQNWDTYHIVGRVPLVSASKSPCPFRPAIASLLFQRRRHVEIYGLPHRWRKIIIARCQIRVIRRMLQYDNLKMLQSCWAAMADCIRALSCRSRTYFQKFGGVFVQWPRVTCQWRNVSRRIDRCALLHHVSAFPEHCTRHSVGGSHNLEPSRSSRTDIFPFHAGAFCLQCLGSYDNAPSNFWPLTEYRCWNDRAQASRFFLSSVRVRGNQSAH